MNKLLCIAAAAAALAGGAVQAQPAAVLVPPAAAAVPGAKAPKRPGRPRSAKPPIGATKAGARGRQRR
jgi:hypothetical protein